MWLNGFSFKWLIIVLTSLIIGQECHALEDKHLLVSLRMIGHEVLLATGDSTGRVLPLVEEDGKYRIRFENEIALQPEQLVIIVNRVVEETNIAKSFIVEVEECTTHDVFYAYEAGLEENADIIPCKSRELPKACYSILFSKTDVNANVTNKEEVKGLNKIATILILLVLLIASISAIIYIRKKKNRSTRANPNWISIGKYHFDTLNSKLILAEQRIELTSKEANLLLLLYETINETVEREVLLNKVWGDEGDYIGRTLDVFISKLRKKLEFDERIKIVNVRGVGYKMVLDI